MRPRAIVSYPHIPEQVPGSGMSWTRQEYYADGVDLFRRYREEAAFFDSSVDVSCCSYAGNLRSDQHYNRYSPL